MFKILIIFGIFINILIANETICVTQWIQENGQKFKPPKSLEILNIDLADDLNWVKLITKNDSSYFIYNSMIVLENRRGVSYRAKNGNLLDLFTDKNLVIWVDEKPILKANCPNLRLDIKKKNDTTIKGR